MNLVQCANPITIRDGRVGLFLRDGDRTKPPFFYVALFAPAGSQPTIDFTEFQGLLDATDGTQFDQFLACFAPVAPDEGSAPFIVQALADALPAPGLLPIGGIAWSDLLEVSLSDRRAITLMRTGDGWQVPPNTPCPLVMSGGDILLALQGQQAANADFGNNTLSIGTEQPLSLLCPDGPIAAGASVAVGFDDTGDWGVTSVAVPTCSNPERLRFGFAYTLLPRPTVTSPGAAAPQVLFYPLFDAAGLQEIGTSALLLTVPFESEPTIAFVPGSPAWSSAYRTTLGDAVLLVSGDGAPRHFAGQLAGDGSLSFSPSGTWTMRCARAGVTGFDMVCGLSGLERLTFNNGDTLTFYPDTSSLVWATPQQGAGSAELTPHLRLAAAGEPAPTPSTTAFVAPGSGTGGPAYAVHSQQVPLFTVTAEPDGLLDAADPAGWTLPAPAAGNAFPLLPYAGLAAPAAGGAALLVSLETLIAAQRESIITATAKPGAKTSPQQAVTPQGFVLTYGTAGLTSVQFAASADGSDAVAMSFSDSSGKWAGALEAALGAAQPFIVVSIVDPDGKAAVTPKLTLDDWALDLGFANQAQAAAGSYRTILIVKAAGAAVSNMVGNPDLWAGREHFTETTVDGTGEVLSGYLKDYIAQTRAAYANGTGVADYGAFLDTVDNPAWTGVLVLNPPIDVASCPEDVQVMLVGTDLQTGPVTAHHLIATPGRIALASGKAAATSSFDAVVHYLRPGQSLDDVLDGQVGLLPSTGADEFLLLYLRAVFRNGVLKQFGSAAGLVLSQILGHEVVAASLDGGTSMGSNALVLEGVMHRVANGPPVYGFVAPRTTPSTFYLASSAVDYLLVDHIETDISRSGTNPVTTTMTFALGGSIRMRRNAGFDIASYEAIGLGGMAVTMQYAIGQSIGTPTFAFDLGNVALAPRQEVGTAANASALSSAPTAHVYREDALVGQWPLRLAELVVPAAGETPDSLGFAPVALSGDAAAAPDLGSGWLGLRLSLSLGSAGLAGTPQLLSGEMLLAWPLASPAAGPAAVAPFFKLIGPDGVALQIEIEGVIKLGINAIRLRLQDPAAAAPGYLLELQGIGLTVLSTTLPMNGGATVYLLGGGDGANRRLGWYGGIAAAGGT